MSEENVNLARVPDAAFVSIEPPEHIPSVEGILKMMERSNNRVGRYELLSDVFELGTLAVSNRFCFDKQVHNEREETYGRIMKKYEGDMQELITSIFSEIFLLLTQQLNPHIGFNDYLGELYMKSETSNSKAGQFFTPCHISKLCASVSLNEAQIKDAIKNDEILTLNEPACGSGGMIIAAIDELYNRYHFNISRNLFVECSDIDSRCVHMTYLQLGLAGIPAVIYQRDTLSMRTWQRWDTPAYTIQYTRFKSVRKGGKQE